MNTFVHLNRSVFSCFLKHLEVLYMKEKIIIVGAGPCGLSTALYLKEAGYDPLIIDRGNIVHTIYRFPTHQTFFSTRDRKSTRLNSSHVSNLVIFSLSLHDALPISFGFFMFFKTFGGLIYERKNYYCRCWTLWFIYSTLLERSGL